MGDPYPAAVLRGLEAAAASGGARLLCFVGGPLPSDPAHASGRHRAYELCGQRSVDGVVVLGSTLIHDVGQRALRRYCARYAGLPLCSIGVELDGWPSVTIDNEVGMERVLEHVIIEHGARRIAFVRGPVANAEADQRLAAYQNTLARHGLPFDEQLVVAGNFMAESGTEAVEALSALPGLRLEELDAIAASNDAMAMGVLAGLDRFGLNVPRQLGVIGFDDVEDARLTQPPLTTVRQPLERLGQEAVRIALEWLRHGVAPSSRQLATEPVIRHSCGCARPSGRAGPSLGPERSLGFEAALLMKRDRILTELTRAAGTAVEVAGIDWADRLLAALIADLRNAEPAAFLAAFDGLIERLLTGGADVNACHDVLGALRAQVVPLLRSDRSRSERAEDLFHLCRVATSQGIQRRLMRDRLTLGRFSRTLNATCAAISSSVEAPELEARVLELLPHLEIVSCRVAVYDRSRPGEARLAFGYDARGPAAGRGASFDASLLVPGGVAAAGLLGSHVVLPLVFREHNLGHMLLELDLRHTDAYSPLADAIGVALHGRAVTS
jgi:DNA-binding LacI/PurR family transcriptional regulator